MVSQLRVLTTDSTTITTMCNIDNNNTLLSSRQSLNKGVSSHASGTCVALVVTGRRRHMGRPNT